jgi:hypothetical protein
VLAFSAIVGHTNMVVMGCDKNSVPNKNTAVMKNGTMSQMV